MPKLPVLRSAQVVQALKRYGFVEMRQRGSHLRLKRGNLAVTVPMHTGDLSMPVLRSILRQAQLTDEEFLALL
jgi:predicted RNA binding protein YcfA (HicA-like mRNA interferase family)